MISAYFVDHPPKIALLPVEFMIKSDLSAFEISIDSVDNPPPKICAITRGIICHSLSTYFFGTILRRTNDMKLTKVSVDSNDFDSF